MKSRLAHYHHLFLQYVIEVVCLVLGALLLISATIWLAVTQHKYRQLFYPGVSIDSVMVSGKTRAQAQEALDLQPAIIPAETQFTFQADQVSISSAAGELGIHRQTNAALDEAFQIGHQDFWWNGFFRLIVSHPPKRTFETVVELDTTKLHDLLSLLQTKVDKPATLPSASLGTSNAAATIKINPGKNGRLIDESKATQNVLTAINQGQTTIEIPVATISSQLTPDQVAAAKERATTLVGKQLIIHADDITERLNDQTLISLLQLPQGLQDSKVAEIVEKMNQKINRPPQNAEFEYDKETLAVKKFVPPKKGLSIDKTQLQQALTQSLTTLEHSEEKSQEVKLQVQETNPEVTLEKTNDLGITEQIGFGESEYFHSIPGRIHNVGLTASRINNTIVKPGQEFSFNDELGDVSAATGFAPAYVIRNGHTELGDGGGVCQVSTTLFRALLQAGLPITKRLPHSYRVSYYELNSKPGIDATVYAGNVDLRFINDTGHHVLIRTENNPAHLYLAVKMFGTSDGRTTEIVDHKTWDYRAAPPPRYQDDPTLPAGTIRQIDFAASGIKASFKNIVKDKEGNILREDTYISNYKPWQAVFLRGTK